jgi:quercetin dioxygenase-like cupin family protein
MTDTSGYFGSATAREEGTRGRFAPIDGQPTITPSPGVHLQPVAGIQLLLSRVTIDPHREAPVHTHDEEQMGIVVAGSGDFELDGEIRRVVPGDTYHAPPGVPHGVRAGAEGCVVIVLAAPGGAGGVDGPGRDPLDLFVRRRQGLQQVRVVDR